MSAYGTLQQGRIAQQVANMQSDQLRTQAQQERAVAHYEMAKQRALAKKRAGDTKAAFASSGFTLGDPTSAHIIGTTAEEETLQELMTKALAEQRARNMERQAAQRQWEGRMERRGSQIKAMSDLLSGGSSWYDRYGKSFGGGEQPAGAD